ncbi:MAG: transcriptional regulator [Candidatus Marinimicrobia bacterium]|nr:transcriptional regulator [Candidatus Neomarinimicrobiota bacterium]|tara:strand:- start:25022 stop:25378 length:357 start_codon:yes stop_codon:yes gene_type:complete
MALKKINKLYYSIGEVSKITGLKQYVLRYWETEFTVLKPVKNTAGNRIYKDNDIKLIKYIQDLLYKKKYTIKGAKMHLTDQFSNSVNKSSDIQEIKQDLINIKKSLTDIVSLISKYKD